MLSWTSAIGRGAAGQRPTKRPIDRSHATRPDGQRHCSRGSPRRLTKQHEARPLQKVHAVSALETPQKLHHRPCLELVRHCGHPRVRDIISSASMHIQSRCMQLRAEGAEMHVPEITPKSILEAHLQTEEHDSASSGQEQNKHDWRSRSI